jgi:hypothetical protein
MLTQAEMIGARDDLRQAEGICVTVRGIYLSAGYIAGARLLNAILGLLADEIAALDKAIAAGQP